MSHLHHKVSALIDGELRGSSRRRALAHLRRCVDCQREIEETLAVKHLLVGLSAAEPSADLFASLDSVHVPPPSARGKPSRAAAVGRRLMVGAGTMSVAVLSLAYVVGAPDEAPVPQVAPPVEEFTAEFTSSTGLEPLSDPAVGGLDGSLRPVGIVLAGPHRGPTGVIAAPRLPFGSSLVAAAVGPGDEPRAVRLLHRAVTAPGRVAYTGTRRISVLDVGRPSSVTIDIGHSPRQGTSFEVTDGKGDPAATFVAEHEVADSDFSGRPLGLLVDAYDIAVVGTQQVLGRAATVIGTSHDGVLAAKFWVDDATGLLLRREIYNSDGRVVRSSGFTTLRVSRDGFMLHLPPELEAPTSTKLPSQIAPSLDDAGWTCPAVLDGDFSLTVLRRLQVRGDVMHAAYSDGLSTLSVFEQRAVLDPSRLQGFSPQDVGGDVAYVRYGLPTVAVWESAGTTYTVVTDAPHDTAAALIAALPHGSVAADGGLSSRLGVGLQRITAFANPVG